MSVGRMSGGHPRPTGGAGPTASGPGRLIVAVYGVLAIAATARSSVQIIRDLDEAPLAYLLSALAAVVYLLATVALARGGGWRPVDGGAVGTEMVGVLVVGAASIAAPDLFPDATVWSGFGQGYGYVPLLLPVAGLWWLARTRPRTGGTDR